ncbi:exonuclease domain-containing protein [Rhizoctonia solani AG-1 IA]|uniref:Exonuclease domain-containing protein n=1 Tax=Thanatephorus cucumeris (strain AG1-IA) TaxID=983506 RepID=L8WZJ4_THACA|nr:exonuclease domain-containing protein [Rhizoctonia solani AG-1 IA]
MDICLMAHPITGGDRLVQTTTTLALQTFEVEYHGQGAHAGAAPWEGRNALDAAFVAYTALSALRQQIHPTARVHGIIEGRDWSSPTMQKCVTLFELQLGVRSWRYVAAAHATSCTMTVTEKEGMKDVRVNEILAHELGAIMTDRYDHPFSSEELPALHPMFALSTVPNGGNHTPEFTAAARTQEAHERAIIVSKGLATLGLRALLDEEFLSTVAADQTSKKMITRRAPLNIYLKEKLVVERITSNDEVLGSIPEVVFQALEVGPRTRHSRDSQDQNFDRPHEALDTSSTTTLLPKKPGASIAPGSNWLALKKKLPTTSKGSLISRQPAKTQPSPSSASFPRGSVPTNPIPDVVTGSSKIFSEEVKSLQDLVLGKGVAGEDLVGEPGRYIAIDCEMVGVGENGSESSLARASIVDFQGRVVLDEVCPTQLNERVTDYRTQVSGVRPKDMINVQARIATLLSSADRILVGHALHNDLTALLLSHPAARIRDTQVYAGRKPNPGKGKGKGKEGEGEKTLWEKYRSPRIGLKRLVKEELGLDIQAGEHSSVRYFCP